MNTILAIAIPFSFGLLLLLGWWRVNQDNFSKTKLAFQPFQPIRPKNRRS